MTFLLTIVAGEGFSLPFYLFILALIREMTFLLTFVTLDLRAVFHEMAWLVTVPTLPLRSR